MRWEGEAAKQFWEGVLAAEAEYIDVYTTTPTTTRGKPLRKVTEIRGSYSALNNEIIEDDGRALFAVTLRDLMPSSCTPRRTRIRITVEAVEESE